MAFRFSGLSGDAKGSLDIVNLSSFFLGVISDRLFSILSCNGKARDLFLLLGCICCPLYRLSSFSAMQSESSVAFSLRISLDGFWRFTLISSTFSRLFGVSIRGGELLDRGRSNTSADRDLLGNKGQHQAFYRNL